MYGVNGERMDSGELPEVMETTMPHIIVSNRASLRFVYDEKSHFGELFFLRWIAIDLQSLLKSNRSAVTAEIQSRNKRSSASIM